MNVLFKKSENNYVYDMQLLFFRSCKLTGAQCKLKVIQLRETPGTVKEPDLSFCQKKFFFIKCTQVSLR
jgi:hypothetical protein